MVVRAGDDNQGQREGDALMRMRSTGLGKTELVGEVNDLARLDDYLVLHVRTTEPVRWHVRTALSIGDLLQVIKLLLRPSNLFFILTHLGKTKPEPPPEY